MIDDNDYEFLLEQQQDEERELLALREAQRLRDRQGQMPNQNKGAGGPDEVLDRCESIYQRSVARRKAKAAAEPPASSTGSRPEKCVGHISPLPQNRTGSPKGQFLLALRKKNGTWRLQLFASEMSNGTNVTSLRFQLWETGEGGHPINVGPGCGFSLSLEEAKKVVEAIQDGLARVKSGKFDPNHEGNFVPRRKGGY